LLQARIADAKHDRSIAGAEQFLGLGAHVWHCRAEKKGRDLF
jgi:hypothetical protein